MPEIYVDVRWPDGSPQQFYSPSLVVEEYLEAGRQYALADFVDRSREALGIASERVRARYGMPCSLAAVSLADIEQRAAGFVDGAVWVERFRR